jgi:hypothetical protein
MSMPSDPQNVYSTGPGLGDQAAPGPDPGGSSTPDWVRGPALSGDAGDNPPYGDLLTSHLSSTAGYQGVVYDGLP